MWWIIHKTWQAVRLEKMYDFVQNLFKFPTKWAFKIPRDFHVRVALLILLKSGGISCRVFFLPFFQNKKVGFLRDLLNKTQHNWALGHRLLKAGKR